MHPFALSIAGGNGPHNNMPPYLALTFIIAQQGVFPARP
jgi:microcystin-dependent protein